MSQLVTYTGPSSQTDNQLRTQTSSRSHAYDPVDKLRVSQPQALIDTDFEYGVQPTKWESINLQNYRQGAYYIPQVSSVIQNASPSTGGILTTNASQLVRIYMNDTSAYTPQVTPVFVYGTTNALANGWWLVQNVSANSYIEYYMTSPAASSQQIFNPGLTYVYPCYFYSQCGFNVPSNFISGGATNTPTITTNSPHTLNIGDLVYIVGTGNSANCNGSHIVATTPSSTTFTIVLPNSLTANSPTNSAGNTFLYMRPAGWVEARPFDGGVAFSAGGTVTNQQLIRQTRRYFRYQSGKGIQFSTGSSLCPTLFQPVLTAAGSPYLNTVTVTTPFVHNLAAGTKIQVSGASPAGYNGTFIIATRINANQFTYVTPILSAPTSATATGSNVRVNPVNWYGSYNAVGFNDQQNGMFFKYDGQQLTAVVRASTGQINGKVQVTQGSGVLSGVGTQFTTQLTPGQGVVIRGQSYRITGILSDTSAFFVPEYRGISYDATNAPNGGYILSVTTDTVYPRSTWFDPLDGTGPSGYNIDLTRMQMWYLDYSWYGAGSIRFGTRNKDGAVIYCHQIQNNNIQFEAFMRSGNLPAHYESSGLTPTTYLTQTLTSGETTSMFVNDASGFNAAGGLAKVTVSGTGTSIEYITYASTSYSATNGWTLNGLTRNQTGGSGSAQTFTVTNPQAIFQTVEYATADSVPSISHWGSSAIMDGQYNDDKSLLLNYGMTTPLTTSGTGSFALLAVRIAPSVDTGTTSILGAKENINRMQLIPDSLSVVATTQTYLINVVLNGRLGAAFSGTGSQPTFITPQQLTGGFSSSLAQVAVNGATGTSATITGGESVAAAYVQAGTVTTLDLTKVRDIGNSILGGGQNNTVPTTQAGLYPDGPDILYIVATPISATGGTIQARFSWTEAQA
jgi:hypothetical protein